MPRPLINIVDSQTGESVIREMNDSEYEAHLAILSEREAAEQAKIQREAALSKLAALGLTADDLRALGL